MRIFSIFICLLLSLTACNNSSKEKASTEDKVTSTQNEKAETSPTVESNGETERKKNSASKVGKETSAIIKVGTYINTEHTEDLNCNCYCLDLNPGETTSLCLVKDKMYINAKVTRSGNNINLYFSEVTSNTTDTKLPWDKFNKEQPIAIISSSPEGYKLDWKGFSIDDEIAVEYALYGKKTLEGTYKKK
ncbi:hypothetical protein [Christiangramia salexigens]|uniref:Lipoprotein n=1 Tax=Christiangramia salexigens TaxID=1913577 RepID=A0A1L3J824_9FLAO|nr:hypothetical protein [Christiangramia salexigens]APG61270.1 hypothetical protein LPB144_13020 [Christiangramia salexigens]